MGKDRHIELLRQKSDSSFLVPDERALAVIERALLSLEQEIMQNISSVKPNQSGWPKAHLNAKQWKLSLHPFARPIQYNRDRP
jgi:hypothetical protein